MNPIKLKHRMIIIALLVLFTSVNAQEPKTLMGPDAKIGFIWGLDTKTGKIQDDISRTNGFFLGALFNRSLLIGVAAGMNVTHPEVNYGYTTLLAQYTLKPDELIHFSGHLLLGTGSTKDYMRKKSNPYDSYGDITGPRFYIIEPGVNVEANLHTKVKLFLGLSYRLATGLDEGDTLISKTNVTDNDLSGVQLNIGIKVGKY